MLHCYNKNCPSNECKYEGECVMRLEKNMDGEKGVKITERGWAGHLIFSNSCGFRRNTLLEYKDKKWIVSTVGAYRNSDGKMDCVGLNRWYETMAFVGTEQDGYIDADVLQEISFESDWGMFADNWNELKEQYPYPDNSANDMHEKVVFELMLKIVKEAEIEEAR